MQGMNRLVFIFPLLLALAGCATGVPRYIPATNGSEGYSETKIQEGVYGVQFKGGSEASVQTITDLVLLRSAEVAIANSFGYFTVLSERAESKDRSITVPENQRSECFGRHCFDYQTSWRTYVYPVPSTYVLIQCFKEKPKDDGGTIFDAQEVRKNIQEQYRLAPGEAHIQNSKPGENG